MGRTQNLFHRVHIVQRRAVTNVGKVGYTELVQNIHGIPPNPPEEHHKVIESLNKITQGIQTKIYELEGLAQSNAFLTSYNLALMVQLSQTNVTMNTTQAQLKTLLATSKNITRTKRKFFCWSCISNFNHGSKICSTKKTGHTEEAFYKKRLGVGEKECKLWLGAITNKNKISSPKLSLINNI